MAIEDMEFDWTAFQVALELIENGEADNPDGFYKREKEFKRLYGRRPSFDEIRKLANWGRGRSRLEDDFANRTLGGLGPETDTIHPSPVDRNYEDGLPDAPNPENPDDDTPSVPATTHGFGSKILYEGEVIETWP